VRVGPPFGHRRSTAQHSGTVGVGKKALTLLQRILDSAPVGLRRKAAVILSLLVLFNCAAWAWAFAAFQGQPVLLGTAFLAYSFGLRHAVDADHIASIDNITRKLIQEGKRPLTVGLFFSLGHSSIVVILSVVVAITAQALQGGFEEYRAIGGTISTLVSAFFLFAIAGANLFILRNTWRSLRKVRRGGDLHADDLDLLLSGGGVMARLFRRMFRLIEKNRHIYFLGMLFGLGFDTATEVGLLGLSASSASGGVSPLVVMVFPMLFCAGMALVDTVDGVLMLGAYGWAFQRPMRKLYYNLVITGLSVAVAIVVGSIETLGLLQDKLALSGWIWEDIGILNDNFGLLGYGIIALFLIAWGVSIVIFKLRRIDEA